MSTNITTIVFAHPWHGSFNKAILDQTVAALENRSKPYQVIDLNKDNFNPVLTQSDLELFSSGESLDPNVKRYQEMIKQSDELIFIFPMWWYDIPAILKGFFEKVMLKDFAYLDTSAGVVGNLKNIKSTKVIMTSRTSKWFLSVFAGNQIKNTFIKATLKSIGIDKVKLLHCDNVLNGNLKTREEFLKTVYNEVSK